MGGEEESYHDTNTPDIHARIPAHIEQDLGCTVKVWLDQASMRTRTDPCLSKIAQDGLTPERVLGKTEFPRAVDCASVVYDFPRRWIRRFGLFEGGEEGCIVEG